LISLTYLVLAGHLDLRIANAKLKREANAIFVALMLRRLFNPHVAAVAALPACSLKYVPAISKRRQLRQTY
jgi:hypothetical protein